MQKMIVITASLALFLAGCSTSNAPVSNNEAGSIQREKPAEVQTGMVTHIKKVTLQEKRSSTGSKVGRTAGSIAGGAIGSGYGSVAGSILGRVLGGAVGSSADKKLSRKPGLEIVIRLDTGQHVTVTQLDKEPFKIGDKVRLTLQDGLAHVTHQ